MLRFLLHVVSAAFAALPLRVLRGVGRGIGWAFRVFGWKAWRTAVSQLTQCLPDKSPPEIKRIARAVFRNQGLNVAEVLAWAGGAQEKLFKTITATGIEHVTSALAGGKGAVILTGHIGNFDLLAVWAASRQPLTVISKDIKNPSLNAFWMERRSQSGLKLVPAHGSYRKCLSALKHSELLGFILDQNMIRTEGIFVQFFGKPACTTPGMAMLSAHAESPVVPAFMIRQPDGSHHFRAFPPMAPPPDRSPEGIRQATQKYTQVLEDVIREYPEQWIWMHRRWRTKPIEQDGASGVQPKS